jgi:heavy metal efflux system protein
VRAVREMGRPILFSKAILLTAFIPVYTMQRMEGRILRPMALTLTFALITGSIFAVFVAPALISFAVRRGTQAEESWIVRQLIRLYRPTLAFALKSRRLVFAFFGALLVCGGVA